MSWFKQSAREDQPYSKYVPEQKELNTLIAVLIREGIPFAEIESRIRSMPMDTVGDVQNLMVKLWTLATEVYGVPRDYLTEKVEHPRRK